MCPISGYSVVWGVTIEFRSCHGNIECVIVVSDSSYILSISHHNSERELTLKAPITTAEDDNFCDIFSNFRKKIRYDIP